MMMKLEGPEYLKLIANLTCCWIQDDRDHDKCMPWWGRKDLFWTNICTICRSELGRTSSESRRNCVESCEMDCFCNFLGLLTEIKIIEKYFINAQIIFNHHKNRKYLIMFYSRESVSEYPDVYWVPQLVLTHKTFVPLTSTSEKYKMIWK